MDTTVFVVVVFQDIGKPLHGVQYRMISVDIIFVVLGLLFFALLFAICDLVHDVEAMYSLS